jgi:hypothetical protein
MPVKVATVPTDGGPASQGQNLTIHPKGLGFPRKNTKLEYKTKQNRNHREWMALPDTVDGLPMKLQTSSNNEVVRKREYLNDTDKDDGLSFDIAPISATPRVMVAIDNDAVTEFDQARDDARKNGSTNGWIELAKRLQLDANSEITPEEAIAASVAPDLPKQAHALMNTKADYLDLTTLSREYRPGLGTYFVYWAWAVAQRVIRGQINYINTPIEDKTVNAFIKIFFG